MRCAMCDRELELRTAYQRVVGWEKPDHGLRGRSGSSLVLRKHEDVFACSGCIAREQLNLAPGQMRIG